MKRKDADKLAHKHVLTVEKIILARLHTDEYKLAEQLKVQEEQGKTSLRRWGFRTRLGGWPWE